MDILKELTEQGKVLGYQGEALQKFVKEQQDLQREERKASRDHESKLRGMEMSLREKDMRIAEQEERLRIIEEESAKKIELMQKSMIDKGPVESQVSFKMPKLPTFDEEKDEMDSYLKRFEMYAYAHGWKKQVWATSLSALLKGKSLDVFARLPTDKALDYDQLKSALLKRFNLTEDGFRIKFRTSYPEEGETFQQYACRLSGYVDRWLELSEIDKSFENLYDLLVREQIVNMCSKDLVLFIKEHVPKDVKAMTTIADQYREARGVDITALSAVHVSGKCGQTTKGNPNAGKGVPMTSNMTTGKFVPKADKSKWQDSDKSEKRCYRCGRLGHIASDSKCPKKTQNKAAAVQGSDNDKGTKVRFDESGKRTKSKSPHRKNGEKSDSVVTCNAFLPVSERMTYVTAGKSSLSSSCSISMLQNVCLPTANGSLDGKVVKVLRDTGCSGVVVKRSLVKDHWMTGEFQRCVLADGSEVEVPIAKLELETPYYSGKVLCWCMDKPVYDVIIGNIPGAKEPNASEESVYAVQTRQQTKQAKLDGKYKALKTPESVDGDIGPDQLKAEQQVDSSLEKIRRLIKEGAKSDKVRFFKNKDIIYREFTSPSVEGGKRFSQVVVPSKFRERVMKLAHESLMGGHLAVKRTVHKVLSEFYWPGVHGDVKRFCQSCDACQRTVPKGKVRRAPLGKMPLIGVPFQRVAVDIVGPIEPRSTQGNRYIVTLMDYATRYPEAIALPSIEAERVAEALLDIFCRLGVPREILTDLGTQFTSGVMREVSRLLSIKQLTTTPFHPACNGLVEKFNGTLKLMLKRLCLDRPKDWDRYLGPVLFAFRDAPQESLNFTPFEMIYGRSVRGPMTILKELWTKEIGESDMKTTYQYVVDLQNRLEKTYDIAHGNLEKASKRYAAFYNRRAKAKQLKVGDKVLVLLPTKANKLLLQWKGPYTVAERVGDLDYKIQTGKKLKTYHANMLKRYNERPIVSALSVAGIAVIDVEQESGVDELEKEVIVYPPTEKSDQQEYKVSDQLSEDEAKELSQMLLEFDDVLSTKPGFTNLGKHDIKLTTDVPIRSKPYPVPFALKQVVIEEVKSMLDLKVIEPSDSQYCSNYVIVKKPDNTNRFCIDFRPLNRVTVFDCEPIPNMEDIFVKLANCKYLSKIDLTKGYWQLPLTEEAKPLTAFQTPIGLFQFKTMPFGLVCASASFSRIMRKLLFGLDSVDNFIDDILVFTETFRRHLKVLRELFMRLRRANLTAKPSKCSFCFETIECLGHIVGGNVLQPNPDKLKAIEDAPRPQTKKQVRSFLGMVGFYRSFVPNFSTIAVPLTDLTKKGAPNKVVWGELQELAFLSLKKALCSFPVLKLPEIEKPFVLQTDASSVGLGAVLLQVDDGIRRPVAFGSRKLNAAEKAYATVEKECLACVWGILKFQRYLYGSEFILETDHQPLSHLSKGKISNPRLMRWALLLQPFRFRIVAIPGRTNVVADYLSRLDCE